MRNLTMNNRTSKAIAKVEHEEAPDVMRLTFRSGETYDYPGVKLSEAVDLAWAEKPGVHFQKHFAKREAVKVELDERATLKTNSPAGGHQASIALPASGFFEPASAEGSRS